MQFKGRLRVHMGLGKTNTASKVSKYGVFFGLYFSVFGLNTEIYGVNLVTMILHSIFKMYSVIILV